MRDNFLVTSPQSSITLIFIYFTRKSLQTSTIKTWSSMPTFSLLIRFVRINGHTPNGPNNNIKPHLKAHHLQMKTMKVL